MYFVSETARIELEWTNVSPWWEEDVARAVAELEAESAAAARAREALVVGAAGACSPRHPTLADGARHEIRRTLKPRFSNYMASCDVESNRHVIRGWQMLLATSLIAL